MRKTLPSARFDLRRETLLPLTLHDAGRVGGGLPGGTTTCNDTTSDLCPMTTRG